MQKRISDRKRKSGPRERRVEKEAKPQAKLMPARRKPDIAKLRESLNVACTECRAIIPPAQQLRVDGDHLRCPECGAEFVPPSQGHPISTS
jgi:predicted RNA-binding Zn-ribbon protein involved in translation (DUF1610 family)